MRSAVEPPSMVSEPTLEVKNSVVIENLVKQFGDFVAVDHVNLEVRKGEVFGFLGPNGAGKTTTIRMLCGLLLPTSGDAKIEELNIKKDTEKIKTIIGYMSQKFSLYIDLTIYENIIFYAGIYGVTNPEKKAKDVIEYLELQKYQNILSSELPAGIRQ